MTAKGWLLLALYEHRYDKQDPHSCNKQFANNGGKLDEHRCNKKTP